MTLYEEAEILTKVVNSRVRKAEQRVKIWLPKKVNVDHNRSVVELINVRVEPYASLPMPSPIGFETSDDIRAWSIRRLQNIIEKVNYGELVITGKWGPIRIMKPLTTCIEFKAVYFT